MITPLKIYFGSLLDSITTKIKNHLPEINQRNRINLPGLGSTQSSLNYSLDAVKSHLDVKEVLKSIRLKMDAVSRNIRSSVNPTTLVSSNVWKGLVVVGVPFAVWILIRFNRRNRQDYIHPPLTPILPKINEEFSQIFFPYHYIFQAEQRMYLFHPLEHRTWNEIFYQDNVNQEADPQESPAFADPKLVIENEPWYEGFQTMLDIPDPGYRNTPLHFNIQGGIFRFNGKEIELKAVDIHLMAIALKFTNAVIITDDAHLFGSYLVGMLLAKDWRDNGNAIIDHYYSESFDKKVVV